MHQIRPTLAFCSLLRIGSCRFSHRTVGLRFSCSFPGTDERHVVVAADLGRDSAATALLSSFRVALALAERCEVMNNVGLFDIVTCLNVLTITFSPSYGSEQRSRKSQSEQAKPKKWAKYVSCKFLLFRVECHILQCSCLPILSNQRAQLIVSNLYRIPEGATEAEVFIRAF